MTSGTVTRLVLRPSRSVDQPVATQTASAAQLALPTRCLYVVGIGSAGKIIAQLLSAFAHLDGFRLVVGAMDTDHRLPDPLVLADGTQLGFPKEHFLGFGVEEPRRAILDSPAIAQRYAEQLATIPVINTYGRGDGGYPVMTAIQIELKARSIRQHLERGLQEVIGLPVAGHLSVQDLVKQRAAQREAPLLPITILVVGGGSGSVGAAGHILVPYLLRAIVREKAQPNPYIVGCVLGPDIYQDLTPRTLSNWLATTRQLDVLSRRGMTGAAARTLSDGTVLNDPTPPYDRIFLLDQKPTRTSVNEAEAELAGFYGQAAKSLYTLLTSDALDRIEASALETVQPWSTVQAATARVDLEEMVQTAAELRATRRLGRLAQHTAIA